MTSLILQAFYLALPAYFANMAPVIFAKMGLLKSLARPIDNGRKLGSDYIFGSGKTWRGIISAVILSIIISGIQAWLFGWDFFRSISVVDYPHKWLIFGCLAGLGAILGDLFKSFLKGVLAFSLVGLGQYLTSWILSSVFFFLLIYWSGQVGS